MPECGAGENVIVACPANLKPYTGKPRCKPTHPTEEASDGSLPASHIHCDVCSAPASPETSISLDLTKLFTLSVSMPV